MWIYLRYVLEEIRDGVRSPAEVSALPDDLAGFYTEQIYRWQGDPDNPSDAQRWGHVRLPLLAALAAAAEPLIETELTAFAGVPGVQATHAFVEGPARAFLLRRDDGDGLTPAFDLSLHAWPTLTATQRAAQLHLWALRARATDLTASSGQLLDDVWLPRLAFWSGVGHRTLTGHYGTVLAVALGPAGGREVVVSADFDGTVRVWDAVTGAAGGVPLTGHDGPVSAVTLGSADGQDVIVSAGSDRTVVLWEYRSQVTGNLPAD